jgi:predicted transport protein
MADIKLFSISDGVTELPSKSVALEKELQTLIEKNMTVFFGITFLKSEFIISNGRIDSLGLDENYCPVIFEYKRSLNENVINQGLFYLNWLLDHKADFKLLVMDILGLDTANKIDWSSPCVICIANDFTKYDEHAVNQMQKNIRLVRYKKFGNDLLLFEHLNAPNIKPTTEITEQTDKKARIDKTFLQQFESAPQSLQNIYISIKDYILSLGDDITESQLKYYTAFKKIKNFICAEIYITIGIILHLKLNPEEVEIIKGFTKDMRNTGHYGTGDLQIMIKTIEDFEKAKPLINRAYHEN